MKEVRDTIRKFLVEDIARKVLCQAENSKLVE
jgi:hypothetical protein